MEKMISILLLVGLLIAAGFYLICCDVAITRFKKDRKWGVFIAPIALLLPYFYQSGSDTSRRKATVWTVVLFVLALGLIFQTEY